jgi:hypothetical protein
MATRWTKTLIMAIPDDDIRSADYNINLNTCRDSFLLLETEVDNQKLTQNAQAQDILGMTSSLTRIDSDVSTLKTDNTKNKSDIATAKSDITLVTGNVNNIKNDITVINNNISALQESVAGINTEVTEESLAFVDNFNDSSLWWGWKKVDPGNDDVVEGSGILSLDTYQSFHGIILPITKSGLSVIETKLLTYTNIATATGFAGLVISDL